MPTPSNNGNGGRGGEEPGRDSPPETSWFDSLFGGTDVRDEIHEQLNRFDERKKRYEEERRRISSSPSLFSPFFVSPGELFGAPPRREGEHEGRSEDRFEPGAGVDIPGLPPSRRNHAEIDEIHREMQSFFEAAFAGSGIVSDHEPPPKDGKGAGLWGGSHGRTAVSSSSSSTTFVSNGASVRTQQDSRRGARIDVELPKRDAQKGGGVALEVLRERPCVLRWRTGDDPGDEEDDDDAGRKGPLAPWDRRARDLPRVVELGDAIDCSRISASLSEARNVLTVEAPVRRKTDREEPPERAAAARSPRSVPVSRRD